MRTDALTSKTNPFLKYVTPKNLVLVALGLAGWHYADMGATKDVSAAVQTVQQKVDDQEIRLNILRDGTQRKVDRDTYDRDIRDIRDRQVHLQDSVDDIKRILIERH